MKVIHIELRGAPRNGRAHYYFGSKAAIYQTFTAEELGISYASLRNLGNLTEHPYVNRKCIIRQGELAVAKNKQKEVEL